MSRILILVEGSTEEQFVKEVLGPHFEPVNKYIIPTIVTTKQVPGEPYFKGGVGSYEKIRRDIRRLCNDSDAVCITTMIDYYGLPDDFPGIAKSLSGPAALRVSHLETAFAANIDDRRFVPYLSTHEFEACLFSRPDVIAKTFEKPMIANTLESVRRKFDTPEDINDDSPPSKRIEALVGEYDKPFFGALIASIIGLERIRAECPHFDSWLSALEQLGQV